MWFRCEQKKLIQTIIELHLKEQKVRNELNLPHTDKDVMEIIFKLSLDGRTISGKKSCVFGRLGKTYLLFFVARRTPLRSFFFSDKEHYGMGLEEAESTIQAAVANNIVQVLNSNFNVCAAINCWYTTGCEKRLNIMKHPKHIWSTAVSVHHWRMDIENIPPYVAGNQRWKINTGGGGIIWVDEYNTILTQSPFYIPRTISSTNAELTTLAVVSLASPNKNLTVYRDNRTEVEFENYKSWTSNKDIT